jgi:hypothetical protein
VIDGWRYFGYQAADGQIDADMGRRHAEVFLDLLRGEGFARPNPKPMFPNPPGLLRLEPYSEGLRERIWWGAGSNATAISYAAEPDVLIEQLKKDEAIAEADTLLLTVPNQLGVTYNAHVIEAILTHVAPTMGWR